ncbi:MAG TPA: glutamate-cysteine ligase family protein [Ktedonobacteraceae bacterium]|jgi:glutamate--cysteine ligase
MLTRNAVEAYHARAGLPPAPHKIGIELELFCLDPATRRMLPYQAEAGQMSIQALFAYLTTHEGYEVVGNTKTFELKKGSSKISLEPGAQIEFCSTPACTPAALLKELSDYFAVLKRLSQRFNISWLDLSYFPVGCAADVPLLPSARCEIIDRYWRQTGALGLDLMRYTTSLHVSFDYATALDLAEKVERALLLKPILFFLAASSRIRQSLDTGVRSFRVNIYKDTDASRTGTPGPEALWRSGRWTLDGYVDKVLQAPAIFAVATPQRYQESAHAPFGAYLGQASFGDYLSHLATIYTDVRVRQYLEVRYLDNPGLRLLPGMVILLYSLFYDDAAWEELRGCLPYTLPEVPAVVDLLNAVSRTADAYWESRLLPAVKRYLLALRERTEPGLAEYLDDVLERATGFRGRDTLPDMSSEASILAHFTADFPF